LIFKIEWGQAMKYYIVDAFAERLFTGNQAGVCILDEWLDKNLMQSIAFENNLAETAFVVKRDGYYDLRWFSPTAEIDLCGHATLASAFIVTNFIDINAVTVDFHTMSGILSVTRSGDLYEMNFPARKPVPISVTPQITQAFNVPVLEAHSSRDLLLLVENERLVKDLTPNFNIIKEIPGYLGVIVTAKGETADFVSRFFAPRVGVPEDPVTGSSHATLIPFWAERLNQNKMTAKQLSNRGGTLYCEFKGERVIISGKAILFMQGEILI
jgi:PhzF family phenazine biosynthesis protein